MVRNLVLSAAVALFAVAACMQTAGAEEKKEPHTIKQVMGKVFHPKKGFLGKVLKGEASDEQKAMLVTMMEDLGANDPPKGSADSWKTKTEALVAAAKSVKEGGGTAGLKKAANCAACHKMHKGK